MRLMTKGTVFKIYPNHSDNWFLVTIIANAKK